MLLEKHNIIGYFSLSIRGFCSSEWIRSYGFLRKMQFFWQWSCIAIKLRWLLWSAIQKVFLSELNHLINSINKGKSWGWQLLGIKESFVLILSTVLRKKYVMLLLQHRCTISSLSMMESHLTNMLFKQPDSCGF